MRHHYFPFRTTTFDSSGQNYFFKWYTKGWIFENHTLKALNIPFKKVILSGRVKCGGTEGEIVVAHGRLPSPTRATLQFCSEVKWYNSTAVQLFSAVVQLYSCSVVQYCTSVQKLSGTKVQLHHYSVAQLNSGATVQLFFGATLQFCSAVEWFDSTADSLFSGATVQLFSGAIVQLFSVVQQ